MALSPSCVPHSPPPPPPVRLDDHIICMDATPLAGVPVYMWTDEQVSLWLRTVPFGNLYTDSFLLNGVNGRILLVLSEDMLENELGVKSKIHRMRLMMEIHDLGHPHVVEATPLDDTTQAPIAIPYPPQPPPAAVVPPPPPLPHISVYASVGSSSPPSVLTPTLPSGSTSSDMSKEFASRAGLMISDSSQLPVQATLVKNFNPNIHMIIKQMPLPANVISKYDKPMAQMLEPYGRSPKEMALDQQQRRSIEQLLSPMKYLSQEHAIIKHMPFPRRDEKRPWNCKHCNKRFRRRQTFVNHLRIHTGEKPFGCDQCDKRFARRDYLTEHLKKHNGIETKPYACHLCDKRFARKFHHAAHIRAHLGIRPFQCPQCQKKFTRQNTLRKHLAIHTGIRPFSCSHCDRTFARKDYLVSHIKTHSGLKPFVCTECDKRFTLKKTLTYHLKKYHPRDDGNHDDNDGSGASVGRMTMPSVGQVAVSPPNNHMTITGTVLCPSAPIGPPGPISPTSQRIQQHNSGCLLRSCHATTPGIHSLSHSQDPLLNSSLASSPTPQPSLAASLSNLAFPPTDQTSFQPINQTFCQMGTTCTSGSGLMASGNQLDESSTNSCGGNNVFAVSNLNGVPLSGHLKLDGSSPRQCQQLSGLSLAMNTQYVGVGGDGTGAEMTLGDTNSVQVADVRLDTLQMPHLGDTSDVA